MFPVVDGRQLEEEIGFKTGLEAILSSKGSLLQFQDLISTSSKYSVWYIYTEDSVIL